MEVETLSFNTQPPEGGWAFEIYIGLPTLVSTHSRPKAAGFMMVYQKAVNIGFNTQPPEGGWVCSFEVQPKDGRFNTQPPEGGWVNRAAGGGV